MFSRPCRDPCALPKTVVMGYHPRDTCSARSQPSTDQVAELSQTGTWRIKLNVFVVWHSEIRRWVTYSHPAQALSVTSSSHSQPASPTPASSLLAPIKTSHLAPHISFSAPQHLIPTHVRLQPGRRPHPPTPWQRPVSSPSSFRRRLLPLLSHIPTSEP